LAQVTCRKLCSSYASIRKELRGACHQKIKL
jgi:hypothetical protein